MKITNQQVLAISEAIQALDGGQVTRIVEGKAVGVFVSYRLGHAARWGLACAQGKLQAVIADFNRAKSALIKLHTDGTGSISPAHPRFNAFAEDFEQLTHQPVELELGAVALDDLKLEENEKAGSEIPIAVLNALSPLIKN
jgi:hypothetical protein